MYKFINSYATSLHKTFSLHVLINETYLMASFSLHILINKTYLIVTDT